MNRLIIVGASGHGKVVADIAQLNGYKDIVFLDDNEKIKECAGYPVVGPINEAPAGDVFVAVGNSDVRKHLVKRFSDRKQPILIHPDAIVARNTEIGFGTVIMAGAVVNPFAKIGRGGIINTSSSVDHDCVVGNYVHVSVGSHLCGTVTIGDEVWIGAGAIVINNVNVVDKTIIGAGAVVVRDIHESGTYVGVPAKIINSYE